MTIIDRLVKAESQMMTMKTISIITPVHAPGAQYLPETYESLRVQQLPSGWRWEWVLQEDGETGQILDLLPEDERISFGVGEKNGPAATRNIALSRSEGELVKALDADDLLSAGALARDITILDLYPEVGWTTCSMLDLLPDGSTVGWQHVDPPDGKLPIGAIFDYWVGHDYGLPVAPVTLCIRRELIHALGGWMALPASEDTGLLIAASEYTYGYFIAEPGLLYRKWPGQSTAQPAHIDPVERAARHSIIEARARAIREYRSSGEW